MPNNLHYIKSDSIITDFARHLGDEFNERILFSAPFGTGKSTFLKNFFQETDDYIVLKLYPINYSVAPNQDVFELIKCELLYELLNKFPDEIELHQDQFSILLISQMYLLHQMKIDLPLKLLAKASSLVAGVDVVKDLTLDTIIQTIGSLSDYKKEINKTEYDLLNRYIKSIQIQKGHIYESDEITQLIISLLARVKDGKLKSNSNLKTVLLIDDLDRLDPEHVFRLFNVFSAHYDDVTESNKFFFDKVVFVCDVKNVRAMFNHRYGFSVEFTGYIDKFYSTEVFNFDMKKYLKESLPQILDESKYSPYKYFDPKNIDIELVKRYNLKKSHFNDSLIYILENMVDSNIIRIRNLKRFNQFTLPNIILETTYGKATAVFYPIVVLLTNLEKLFIHQTDLENSFEFLYKSYTSNYEVANSENKDQNDEVAETIIQYSLQFIMDERRVFYHHYDRDKKSVYPFLNENGEKIFIIYIMQRDVTFNFYWPNFIKCIKGEKLTDEMVDYPRLLKPNPYWFLYNAYKKIKSRNYF